MRARGLVSAGAQHLRGSLRHARACRTPAGSPALLKLVASCLLEATACLEPAPPQPAGSGAAAALPQWAREKIDQVADQQAQALPTLPAAQQMLQNTLMGCILHLLAGGGEVEGGGGPSGSQQHAPAQPAQAALPLSPSTQPAKRGAH